jgi:hypothetical protein
MSTHGLIAMLATAVALMGVAACGDDDDGTASSAPTIKLDRRRDVPTLSAHLASILRAP